MYLHSRPTAVSPRRSFVLLVVLVVLVLLTLAGYQFGELMLAESTAADSYARYAQARALADSGVHYAAAVLSNNDAFTGTLNSNPYNNPQAFQGIVVNPQALPNLQGRFSIVALPDPDNPDTTAGQPYFFGVTDESAKINLNAIMQVDSSGNVASNMLMTLPNMTQDIANSILDWIDTDEDSRADGAESDYYSTQTPSYMAKDGRLDSIEELLYVKGVTPQLLLGNDQNRNGILDPGEDDGSGTVNRGWSAYLTVYSREQNVDSQGNPRINVNDSDLDTLSTNLSTAVGQDLANFILAARLYGLTTTGSGNATGGSGSGGNGGGTGSAAISSDGKTMTAAAPSGGSGGGEGGSNSQLSRNQLNTKNGGNTRISSLYQLINATVSIPGSTPQEKATTYPSPLNDPGSQEQLLPLLLDECTTVNTPEIPARINVNTAPQTVLMALPGLSESDVQNILATRPSPSSTDPPDAIFQTPAWLVTRANLSPSKVQALEKYITARTQVYRVQVVGYFDRGGPSARVEAVIDTNQGSPRILYYRDLTELGKGFNPAQLGAGGQGP